MSDDDEHQYVTSFYVNGIHVKSLEYSESSKNTGVWTAQAEIYSQEAWHTFSGYGTTIERALRDLSDAIEIGSTTTGR